MSFLDASYPEMLLRLVVAVLLGGMVGFERAEKNHDAGLRTHILVCLASAAVMVMSELLLRQYGNKSYDVSRLGAQVISGIGFLGAGCIIANGNKVKGLTTAAGLWATSCVGLLVGIGYYAVAVTVVALMLTAMLGLQPLADRLHAKSFEITIHFQLSDRSQVQELLGCVKLYGLQIHTMYVEDQDDGSFQLVMETQGGRSFDQDGFLHAIGQMQGVREVSFL